MMGTMTMAAAGLAALTAGGVFAAPEPPANFRTETRDAAARRVCVSWDMPDGVTDCAWRTFTTVRAGGIPASRALWRAPFADVPAAKTTRKLDAAALEALPGFAGWEGVNVRQTPVAGALLLGWDKHASGVLTTPPLARAYAAGTMLAVAASVHETVTGVMPLAVVSGGVTSHVADVALTKTPQECAVPLPALAPEDRLVLHSSTNYATEKTFVYDLALCAPGTYVPACVLTNACSQAVPLTGHAVELLVPAGGTNLWLEVQTIHAGAASEWSAPYGVALPSGGAGETPDGSLAPPSGVRAGRLPDGSVRLGWSMPADATNVRLRVWSCSVSGGLAEAEATDILWRETFAAAPATNSTVKLNTAKKWELYSDLGTNGWAWEACSAVYLAPEAGAVQVGKTDGAGTLATRALGFSGNGLTLVATARRRTTSSGTDLRAALVSQTGKTNWTGSATVGDVFSECAFPLDVPLAADDALVLSSPTGGSDRRLLLSDVAFVRGYAPVAVSTNELLAVDLGARTTYDLPAADGGGVRLLALSAQGPDGRASAWTSPLALDPAALGPWREREVALHGGTATAAFDPALPASSNQLAVLDSPFRFLLDGEEVEALPCRDATKQLNAGIYVCTNVLEADWIVLVPGSPPSQSAVREAEMRLSVATGAFAAQRVEIEGVFAQLNATNSLEKALALQWRVRAPDGTAGDWTDCGRFASTYTTADVQPDLAGTVRRVTGAADLRAPAGARVEARIHCAKAYKSGREAPLGFRAVRVCVLGEGRNFMLVVH